MRSACPRSGSRPGWLRDDVGRSPKPSFRPVMEVAAERRPRVPNFRPVTEVSAERRPSDSDFRPVMEVPAYGRPTSARSSASDGSFDEPAPRGTRPDRMRGALAARPPSVEDDLDLVELAVRLGWYDQAHLTNDFRRMLGETPGQYAARTASG